MIQVTDSRPIAVRKPHYGLHEAPIMQKRIDKKLLDLGFSIKYDRKFPRGFHITLAPNLIRNPSPILTSRFGAFASTIYDSTT